VAIQNGDRRHQAPEVDDHPPSPWTRPGFVVSAVLVLAIVVTGIVLSVTHGHGSSATPKTAPATPRPVSASPSHVTAAGSDSVCGLPNGNQSIPTSPPSTTWTLVGSVAAPSSPTTGPGALTRGVRTCFAHNPVGALFFAATAGAEGTDPHLSSLELDQVVLAEGPGKQKALASDAASQAQAPTASTDLYQVSGYRFLDYSADRTTFELVIRLTSGPQAGALTAIPETLVWVNGDWRGYVPDTGISPAGTAITSLAGYTAWSGA
jgi:hypothetical protein